MGKQGAWSSLQSFLINTLVVGFILSKTQMGRYFSGDPVVMTPLSNAGGSSSIPGQRIKIPHAEAWGQKVKITESKTQEEAISVGWGETQKNEGKVISRLGLLVQTWAKENPGPVDQAGDPPRVPYVLIRSLGENMHSRWRMVVEWWGVSVCACKCVDRLQVGVVGEVWRL